MKIVETGVLYDYMQARGIAYLVASSSYSIFSELTKTSNYAS